MGSRIRHSGVVDKIEDDCVKVRIVQSSACSSCNAARLCNAAEKKEKIVDVYNVAPKDYSVGEKVTVTASSQVGMNAVLLAFGVPFFILVAVAFITGRLTDDEPVIALAAICSLIPYYVALYFNRHRMQEKFTFTMEKTKQEKI